MKTAESQARWAQYGKAMMLISGVNCLILAWLMPIGVEGKLLRIWVGSFGLLNVFFAFKSRFWDS